MAEQRRVLVRIAAAASLMLAAVLVWWLLGEREGDPAIAADDQAAAIKQRPGTADAKRPAGTKLDLVGAPKAAISGTVRDVDGDPIANAQVCAASRPDQRLGVDDRKPHCVRTDPKGHYAIDDLLPIPTEVHASAASFQPGRWTRRGDGRERNRLSLRAGQTRKDIDITLAPGGVLVRGVVKDIAGGEIAGATVVLSKINARGREGMAYTVSGDDGSFEQWIAPGDVAAVAEVEGYAMGWVLGVAPGQFLELFLTPESVLIGRVVLADGNEPVEGAVVDAVDFGQTSVRTDADGRFRVERLAPGSYKPTAKSDTLYGEAAEQVHLGLGETSEEIVIRVHPAVLVEGRVVIAGSDRPCTSGSVRLESPTAQHRFAELDDEGRVSFRGVLSGTYRVAVDCDGHISEQEYPDLVVEQQDLVGLEWEVREGLAIRGVVVDETGEPIESIDVSARPVVDPDAARAQTTSARVDSQTDGSFELGGLLPGRYEVMISSWTRPRPDEPITVELDGADVNDVRLVLPASGSLRGRVVDDRGEPVSAVLVTANAIGAQGFARGHTNDAGEFTLEHLRPGSTRVTAADGATFGAGTTMRKPGTSDDDLQGEVVEVVANELAEVTLIVESRDGRITGVVKDEGGGPVADAFIDVERMSERAGANAAAARRSVRWSWGSQPVLTDADGRFELTELPDGKFIIRANRKGGGEATLEQVAIGSHVELVIASTGELSGTVALDDGTAPERFTVSIEDKAQMISVRDTFFRTDGAWRLSEVPTGTYEISATATQGNVKLEPALELDEGEARDGIELVLSSRVTVRGRVVDLETREPVAGISVYVSGWDMRARRTDSERRNVSDADGRFELDDVPIGEITISGGSFTGGSKGKYERLSQPLTIAAQPEVQNIGELEIIAKRLEPNQESGDLGFRLVDSDPSQKPEDWQAVVASVRPDGPAAAAGLAAGDVIEKVDGHEVGGLHRSRWWALTRVVEGTKLTLELAGGKTLELVAGKPI